MLVSTQRPQVLLDTSWHQGWFDWRFGLAAAKPVVIDETGLSTKMACLPGPAINDERCRPAGL